MDEKKVLDWLNSSLDELIDFDGYMDGPEDVSYEGRKFIEIGNKLR